MQCVIEEKNELLCIEVVNRDENAERDGLMK